MVEMEEDPSEMICPAAVERNPGTTIHHRLPVRNTNEEATGSAKQPSSKSTEGAEESRDEFVPKIRWPDTIVQIFLHAGCLYGLFLCLVSAKFYTTLFAIGALCFGASLFPAILFVTLPVSTTTAERSFSTIKRLKTHLRSTIGEESLNGLTLLNIHNEVDLNIVNVINTFATSKARRMSLEDWSAFLMIYITGFGITAGAHRLWSHRAYKAKWPLRLLLVILFTVTGQRHVYVWALDHRVHHKYSETDADPHNAKRGFFFSHVGWLILTPHPSVVEKRKAVDMSDLEADPIVMWQKRNISPVENLAVSIAALGEGWHNYHHVFPWDYKTGELGNAYNPSTTFINFFAKLGWAYELKSVSQNMILRRAQKTGDGSHPQIWGYGDKDMEKEDLMELENMAEEKSFLDKEK
ncbi:unnamed protein product [Phaedon cochleariae]|uniref:HAT C-terminal dimerisation domain-containing protein n=1 Tax=Phaedon cochleariae TaxID=80249 RepID=A0A9N9SD47_PHACE|nr:unnamed protein product [Phaedon cochleariae]